MVERTWVWERCKIELIYVLVSCLRYSLISLFFSALYLRLSIPCSGRENGSKRWKENLLLPQWFPLFLNIIACWTTLSSYWFTSTYLKINYTVDGNCSSYSLSLFSNRVYQPSIKETVYMKIVSHYILII